MKNGWIKLWRMEDSSSYYDLAPAQRLVWIELLLSADHQTGIASVGLRLLARRVKCALSTVQCALERLETLGMISVSRTPKVRGVHRSGFGQYNILNWHKFQGIAEVPIGQSSVTNKKKETRIPTLNGTDLGSGVSTRHVAVPRALWDTLTHYGVPTDKTDRIVIAKMLRAGADPCDLACRAAVGVTSLGAKTVRGAVSQAFLSRFSDPFIENLEIPHARKCYLAFANALPGLSAGRGAGDPGEEFPTPIGFP